MEIIELMVAILAPTITLCIFLIIQLINITSRLTKLETNSDLLLKWVACLNGEMSDKKEFKEFLTKLKKVNKQNLCD